MPTQTVRTRHAARSRPAQRQAPRHVRRVSGPLRPAPAGAPASVRRGTTGVFERIRALPEHRVVDAVYHDEKYPERRDILRAKWRRSLVWEAPKDT